MGTRRIHCYYYYYYHHWQCHPTPWAGLRSNRGCMRTRVERKPAHHLFSGIVFGLLLRTVGLILILGSPTREDTLWICLDVHAVGTRRCVSVRNHIYSVSSVVGIPWMWCLDVVGRDVWDRVGRESIIVREIPPRMGGWKPSPSSSVVDGMK